MEIREVEDNLLESFRALASHRDSGEVRDIAGISIASAGTSFQMFNAAFFSCPVVDAEDLERRVCTARVHFQARGLSWSFWACHGFLPPKLRKKAIFERNGLRHTVQLPGMCAEQLRQPIRKLPGLEIRPVNDEATRLAFCEIGCACFHVPLNWFREIFLTPKIWENDFAGFVGYRNGEPVTTAATVTAGGVVGVYNVATLPAHRRLGYGEAVVRHAIEQARRKNNCQRTILQATEHGLQLYLDMGYRTVTAVDVYASD